ncbi:MAG: 50S ribosomal protein L10 [Gammaproteobacteria bacterium]|nr:50S ribosomal protein L10 [Gammaproteobacteria bacterium]
MPVSLADKKAIIASVFGVAASAHSAVAAEYRGLTVAEMTNLRDKAREAGVYLRVVRNTLARRAVQGTDFECMSEGFVGPLVLAFAQEEPGSSARVMGDFAKTNDKLKIRLVAFGGKLLDPSQLDILAKMPTREEALSQLIGVMQAPVSKFVRTMAEPHAKFVRTVAAYRDKLQEA